MSRHFNFDHRQLANPVPRLPHPSWARQADSAAKHRTAVSAAEFWNRLGL
jgi:hypothetical protein